MVFGMAISSVISIFYFQAQALIGRAEDIGDSVQEVMGFKTLYSGVVLLAIGAGVVFLFKRRPIFVIWMQLVASAVFLLQGFRNGFLILFLRHVLPL